MVGPTDRWSWQINVHFFLLWLNVIMREIENISTTQLCGIRQLVYQDNTESLLPCSLATSADLSGRYKITLKFLAVLEARVVFRSCHFYLSISGTLQLLVGYSGLWSYVMVGLDKILEAILVNVCILSLFLACVCIPLV